MELRLNGERLIELSTELFVLYVCLPISMAFLNSYLIHAVFFVAAMSFLVGLLLENRWNNMVCFLALFFVAMLFWFAVWRSQTRSISYVYYCFASLSVVFGGIVIYESEDSSVSTRMFAFVTLVFVITALTTIRGLSVYPLASREIARGSTYENGLNFEEYKQIYRRMNIAGWSQIYGMVFFVPGLSILWKKSKSLVWILCAAVMLLTIVTSQITFAAILATALLIGVLVVDSDNKQMFFFLLSFFIAALLVVCNLEEILTWVVNTSKDMGFDYLSKKIYDLEQLLVFKHVTGDANARGEFYMNSLHSFINSPISGQLFNPNITDRDIGRHSDLLDIIGATGLIGLLSIIASISMYFRFLNRTGSVYKREWIIIFIGFLALFSINPILNSSPIFVGAFLYTPLCIKVAEEGFSFEPFIKFVY